MRVYECKKCGNVLVGVEDRCPGLTCCGIDMYEAVPKVTDEGSEKHLPYVSVEDDSVYVSVGEVMHVMEEEHYIKWVMCLSDEGVIVKYFKPTDTPECVFPKGSNMKVYAYCNKHGLWVKEIN